MAQQVSISADDVSARVRALSRALRDIIDGAPHLQDAVNSLASVPGVNGQPGGLVAAFGDDADEVNALAGALLDIVGRVKGSRRDGDDGTSDKTYFPAMFWGA